MELNIERNERDGKVDRERKPYQRPSIVYRGQLEAYASLCGTKSSTCGGGPAST